MDVVAILSTSVVDSWVLEYRECRHVDRSAQRKQAGLEIICCNPTCESLPANFKEKRSALGYTNYTTEAVGEFHTLTQGQSLGDSDRTAWS